MLTKTIFSLILAIAAIVPVSLAQSVNEVNVTSNEPGAPFQVDGHSYVGRAVFLWPQGSKHFITADSGASSQWGTIYQLVGVTTNLGSGVNPITADASLKWINLNFSVEYLVTISVSPECPNGVPCSAPGRVDAPPPCAPVVNTVVRCYLPRTQNARFAAYPGPGAIFLGWTLLQGVAPELSTTYLIDAPINGPTAITAQFMPAAAVTAVTLQTDPQEFTVIVDSARLTPPASFEWGWNTVHHIAVEPTQVTRNGVPYVFESWSDGGDFSHDVTVPSPSKPITFTANFVPAHTVRFSTSPPNLKLTIDGRQDWPNYGFAWLPGSVHRISAPATQTDAQGHRYRFVSWSTGQPASFDYTAGPPKGDVQLVATYQLLGQATITTSPLNLSVDLDGAPCATPCVVERDAGQSVRVTVAPMLNDTQRSRLVFRGWTDAIATSRVIQLSADPKTYVVNYATQNRLSITAVPQDGAVIELDPPSADGFYDVGSVVSLTAALGLGFRIRTWSGDVNGNATSTSVMVDAPKDVLLMLDRVPAIGPSGIRSAAVGASADDVAPGSLISIFGANLATGIAVGPTNPLAQTLQGVVVRVDDTFLPLVFVSPEQINAQLPVGTPLGTRRVTLRSDGNQDVSRMIRVVRNSPGLFSGGTDQPIGFFVHVGGEPVTTDQPARPGDMIAVFGTGLGPYASEPPDGFVLDESSGYTVLDKVLVIAGDSPIDASFAGRSSAGAGVDAVRFRVPLDIPDRKTLPLKVNINGRDSNTVLLPVAR